MPAANFQLIYDFETAIPVGFKRLFAAEDVVVIVPDDGPMSKMPRPRIEMFFSCGPETGHLWPASIYGRADAFTGTIGMTVLSNVRPADVGTKEHADYVATVRDLMARATTLLKTNREGADTYLPYHAIDAIVATGCTPHYESQDGYYQTDMNYDIRFSIRPDAWPAES